MRSRSSENPSRLGRYHFTLAHEVGHWRLHRQHFMANTSQRLLFEDGTPHPDVVCHSSEKYQPVEWQANTFAACMLMPRKMIYEAWAKFRHEDDGPISIGELRERYAGKAEASYYRGALAVDQETRDLAMKEIFCKPFAYLTRPSKRNGVLPLRFPCR